MNQLSIVLIKINREDMDIPYTVTNGLVDIQKLLEPFHKVTLDISGEKFVTISRVIPVINSLKHLLISFKAKGDIGEKFQGILCKHLDRRFGQMEAEKNFAYSTILDPRF